MRTGYKLAFHVHGVLGRQSGGHSEVVIVFSVHHGGVNNTRSIGGGDPIGFQNRPCGIRIACIDGFGEERFVSFSYKA